MGANWLFDPTLRVLAVNNQAAKTYTQNTAPWHNNLEKPWRLIHINLSAITHLLEGDALMCQRLLVVGATSPRASQASFAPSAKLRSHL